jgi:uncharacterized protein
VMLVDGQNLATPLRIETVGKAAPFRGLQTLDRWQLEPSLNDLVTEFGPDLGMPKYYRVLSDAPALRGEKVHHSRVLRLEGIRLPYWQRVMENLWSISVLERLWDRMLAFDSATTGMAQLAYKAYQRYIKIEGYREVIAEGGQAMNNLTQFVSFIQQFASSEGVVIIDQKDDFAVVQQPSFTGLAECVVHLGQQNSGAMEIPLVRLFGQSPVGLNSTGESDLRTYYDGINKKQNREMRVPVTKIYRMIAQTLGIGWSEDATIEFKSLWVLSDDQKAAIAAQDTTAVTNAFNAGITSPRVSAAELKQLSKLTGRFTNITDKDIRSASDETGAQQQALMQEEQLRMQTEEHNASLTEPRTSGRAQ